MKKLTVSFLLLVLFLAGCPGGPSDLEVFDEINAVRDQVVMDWRAEASGGNGSPSEQQSALDAAHPGKAGDWMDHMANSIEPLSEVAREHWDKGEEARRKAIREAALKSFKEAHPEHN